jgi:PAS domain S-box-containing protein
MTRANRRAKASRAGGHPRAAASAATGMAGAPDVLDLFTRTHDGVVAVDPACRVILWNRAAEVMLGYTAADVLGRRCHEVIGGRDPAGNLFCHPHCSVLTMARREEPAHAYDLTAPAKDGSERRLNVSTILVPSSAGNIVVHLFRDVTGARPGSPAPAGAGAAADGGAPAGPPAKLSDHLTAREREILRLMASGEGTQAIAQRLFISTATVRNHTQNILTKLSVHSRLEAVALAFRVRVI